MHLVSVKEHIMRKGNKKKTEILVSLSALLFGVAVFFGIVEVLSEMMVH